MNNQVILNQTKLDEAKKKMKNAGALVMKTNLPRNLDGAWKSVAMQYSEAFVLENHSELQRAFNAGLRQS